MIEATQCQHKGCSASPATGQTLYTTDKGSYCALHFTADRHHSDPNAKAKGKKK